MSPTMLSVSKSRFTQPLRSAAYGLVASLALYSATPTFAGVKEIAAVVAKLGNSIESETSVTDLTNAFTAAINDPLNSRLKPGVIAGEILRLATVDVGGPLATVIKANTTLAPNFLSLIAVDAIKTAGTGRAPKVDNIPDFAAGAVTNPTAKAEYLTLALKVTSSKNGVGAILSGFSQQAGVTDADRTTLIATDVLVTNKKLAGSIMEISRFVGSTTTSPAAFAGSIVTANPTAATKIADKILVGVIAGNPTQAGAITDGAKTIPGARAGTFLLASRAATLARSIGAVADIEQIQKVGEVLAGQVLSRSSSVIAVASALSRAIASKAPTVTSPTGITGATPAAADNTGAGVTRNANKVDELGELAAYILNAARTTPDLSDATKGSRFVFSLISSIVKSARVKPERGNLSAPVSLVDVVSYVTGSVVVTLRSLATGAGVVQALADLATESKLRALAAASGNRTFTAGSLLAVVNAALTDFNANGTRFEDGTKALGTGPGALALTDPETNTRSF